MMNKKTGLIALLASCAAGGAMATSLTNYTSGDVLVCFRNGSKDMVVDVGSLSTFTNLGPNQSISIGQYNNGQINAVIVDGMSWSAFTWLGDNSLCVTRPRITPNTPSTPWQCRGAASQHGSALRMATIPPGAADQFSELTFPVSTAGAVVEEDLTDGNPNYIHGSSYHSALSGAFGGNFNGTFVGNPENTTAADFSTSATVSRSDFYQMTPTSGVASGKLLGYFELASNGAMTYTAFPLSVPVITSISRTNNTTTIVYTTGTSGSYKLRGATDLISAGPLNTWPILAPLTSGDTASHSISFTDMNNSEYYIISGQ